MSTSESFLASVRASVDCAATAIDIVARERAQTIARMARELSAALDVISIARLTTDGSMIAELQSAVAKFDKEFP